MTYGIVLGVLFIHLGIMLSTLAYWLVSRAICPDVVDWAEQRMTDAPVRTFFAGALIGVPLFVVGVILVKNPGVPGLLQVGSVLLLLLLLLALAGSAGFAQRVGRGLSGTAQSQEPWRPVMRGGVVLLLAAIAPVLGWFIFLPFVLTSGLGASFSYLRRGRRIMANNISGTIA